MAHTTYDILALYTPKDRRRKPIMRWIASVCTDDAVLDPTLDYEVKARATMPDAAEALSAVMAAPRGAPGHAATMAKVNYWADRPGVPA